MSILVFYPNKTFKVIRKENYLLIEKYLKNYDSVGESYNKIFSYGFDFLIDGNMNSIILPEMNYIGTKIIKNICDYPYRIYGELVVIKYTQKAEISQRSCSSSESEISEKEGREEGKSFSLEDFLLTDNDIETFFKTFRNIITKGKKNSWIIDSNMNLCDWLSDAEKDDQKDFPS
jgi:hypothetical protein